MKNENTWAEMAARTSTGRIRSSNEDAWGARTDQGIFLVCDGMGGAAGGEVASHLTVDTILDRLGNDSLGTGEALHEVLHAAIAEANRSVLECAERNPGLFGMGTTLVALLLRPGSAVVAHAGDSRCYLFREGQLTRCTRDHSLVDEQMRLGAMTQEEAERSPFRSVITRAVGTQQSVMEEIADLETKPGDLFLLCSDGLTREVSEDEIAGLLGSESSLDETAGRLIDAANEAGGRDNVTCLLARVP